MALFKIFKGNETEKLTNSSATGYRTPTDGYAYYDTSTNLFYIDAAYGSDSTITREPINANISNIAMNGIFYGTCETAAATKTKVATLVNGDGFSLTAGVMIAIKFAQASAESTMTLTVNGSTAKNLVLYGTTAMSSGTTTSGWRAGAIVPFVYDGTNWIRLFWENSTYNITSVWCNTAAGTAAKASSNASYYVLKDGNIFEMTIRYANTAAQALTLNVNTTGAKALYINGAPSSTTNYTLPAGKYLVRYDASGNNGNGCYHIRTDGKVPVDIAGNAATATYATTAGSANAVAWANVTGHPVDATNTTGGLLTDAQTVKLASIQTGAEVNQNAFGKVQVGSTTIEADAKIDTLEFVGSNVTITPDATNDKVTFSLTSSNVTTALGYTPPQQDTTYSAATQSAAGLMSAADKKKLDGIATSAQVNVLESVTASGTAPLTLSAGAISNKSIAISGSIAAATTEAKGVVQVGSGLNVNSGTVSVATTAGTSTLAWGSEVTLGTVGGLAIKAKLPSNPNSDTKVTQTNSTTNADYRIVLSGTADDTTRTETANKSTNLRFNPSTKVFSVGGDINATGDLTITGVSNLNGETYASSLTAGSLLVNGAANFVQIPTAPTPATSSNDTSVATTAFVKNNLGGLSGAMHFKGTTTTEMTDGRTTAAVTISGSSYTPSAGDVVLYSDSEFVWTGSAWERLGRDSSFKVQQTAVTTATAETTTATTFVHSITQDANGVITVKTRPLPTYNNYSLPTASTSTKGGIKVGTGLTMSGEVMNHSNSVTAQTTQALYPIKIDAQGHISAYGTAVTSLPASDVYAWAKASTKPTYNWGEITQSGANSIEEGTSDFTDNTELFSSYASNNGFADSAATGKVYRRDAVHMYNYVKTKLAVTNNNINLSRNTETTIATIGGTAIKIKLPASDNTDTKQNITLATTSKAYLTGVTTTPTSTAQALTGVADTGVYLTATAGEISAVRQSFNVSGTEKAYITYNNTTNALDFIFV